MTAEEIEAEVNKALQRAYANKYRREKVAKLEADQWSSDKRRVREYVYSGIYLGERKRSSVLMLAGLTPEKEMRLASRLAYDITVVDLSEEAIEHTRMAQRQINHWRNPYKAKFTVIKDDVRNVLKRRSFTFVNLDFFGTVVDPVIAESVSLANTNKTKYITVWCSYGRENLTKIRASAATRTRELKNNNHSSVDLSSLYDVPAQIRNRILCLWHRARKTDRKENLSPYEAFIYRGRAMPMLITTFVDGYRTPIHFRKRFTFKDLALGEDI